ncbi:hypothetical protein HYV64_04440 [Candidatus Shapirobacteria bacterium]|nr:hypothetical protein [Candidatus Shapirobacteria bacterium]
MTQTAKMLLEKITAKIPRVKSQVDGLNGVLERGEFFKRGEIVPLTEAGRSVRQTLLKHNLLSLADLYARREIVRREIPND